MKESITSFHVLSPKPVSPDASLERKGGPSLCSRGPERVHRMRTWPVRQAFPRGEQCLQLTRYFGAEGSPKEKIFVILPSRSPYLGMREI